MSGQLPAKLRNALENFGAVWNRMEHIRRS